MNTTFPRVSDPDFFFHSTVDMLLSSNFKLHNPWSKVHKNGSDIAASVEYGFNVVVCAAVATFDDVKEKSIKKLLKYTVIYGLWVLLYNYFLKSEIDMVFAREKKTMLN